MQSLNRKPLQGCECRSFISRAFKDLFYADNRDDELTATKRRQESPHGRADERLKREFRLITLPGLILRGTADKATKPSGSQLFFETAFQGRRYRSRRQAQPDALHRT